MRRFYELERGLDELWSIFSGYLILDESKLDLEEMILIYKLCVERKISLPGH